MRNLFLASVLITLLIFPNLSFRQNKTFTKQDSLAIVKIARFEETVFNSHDSTGKLDAWKYWRDDAKFTNVVGYSLTGKKNIREFHEAMNTGKPGTVSFKESSIKYADPKIIVVKPDVASVDILWYLDKVTIPDGTIIRNRRGLITWLMVKEKGTWGIAIMHNAELPSPTANKYVFKRHTTLRTIAESSIKEAPVNDLLTGAFGYCLLTDAWLSATLTLS